MGDEICGPGVEVVWKTCSWDPRDIGIELENYMDVSWYSYRIMHWHCMLSPLLISYAMMRQWTLSIFYFFHVGLRWNYCVFLSSGKRSWNVTVIFMYISCIASLVWWYFIKSRLASIAFDQILCLFSLHSSSWSFSGFGVSYTMQGTMKILFWRRSYRTYQLAIEHWGIVGRGGSTGSRVETRMKEI